MTQFNVCRIVTDIHPVTKQKVEEKQLVERMRTYPIQAEIARIEREFRSSVWVEETDI